MRGLGHPEHRGCLNSVRTRSPTSPHPLARLTASLADTFVQASDSHLTSSVIEESLDRGDPAMHIGSAHIGR